MIFFPLSKSYTAKRKIDNCTQQDSLILERQLSSLKLLILPPFLGGQ
jgi:hypothetical protein